MLLYILAIKLYENVFQVHAFLLEVSETSPTFEVLGLFTLTKQVIISVYTFIWLFQINGLGDDGLFVSFSWLERR